MESFLSSLLAALIPSAATIIAALISAKALNRVKKKPATKGTGTKDQPKNESVLSSPWQKLTWFDKISFILDHVIIFGGLLVLWSEAVLFKPEPLTTKSCAFLVVLGTCVVLGAIRSRD